MELNFQGFYKVSYPYFKQFYISLLEKGLFNICKYNFNIMVSS